MSKIFSLIFILVLSLFSQKAISQSKDTILYINGTVLITTVIDTTIGQVRCKNPKEGRKPISIDNDQIFSISNSKGERILYVYDTTIGNDITIDEMRYYIKGEQDAQKAFRAPGSFWIGTLVGAGAGLTGNFLCPVVPFAFTAMTGITKVRIRKSTVSNLEYLKHETYIMGYEHTARGKRKVRSLIGGGIGLAAGLGGFAILKNNGFQLIP